MLVRDFTGYGEINPFRYRGYYYDTESRLYYLITRYYDPRLGVFLTRDSTEYLEPEEVGGVDLYAYCYNNPVMYSDPNGHFAISTLLISMALGFLAGGVISGCFEIGNQIYNNGWNLSSWDWQQIGLSALGGAVAGMISAVPIGGLAGAFILGGIGSVAGGLITGSVNSIETALVSFGIGAIANVVAYGISDKLANIKASKIFNQSNKAKSLAVQKLQGHPLNMGAKVLKGSFRNSFKQTTQKEILSLIKNANPWIRYSIYSSIFSSTMSGWY